MKPTKIPVRIPVVQKKVTMKYNAIKWRHFIVFFCCSMLLFLSSVHAQIVTTIVGNGTAGYSGNGGPATAAEIDGPGGIVILSNGDMLITDNNSIRKVSTSGIISLFAGTTGSGYSGDNGPATAAQFRTPSSIVIDASGNIYFTDAFYGVVRKINTSGIITTVAGNGTLGYSGDNGPATAAELNGLSCMTIDGSGNLLINDYINSVIRKVDVSGIITTIAGTGTEGFSGDGGPATAAELATPVVIVTDASGNIYFTDNNNFTIRKINPSGIITTIAGTGIEADRTNTGDGMPATNDSLLDPCGLALDGCGNIYFTDIATGVIRKIDASGIITTIAGIWTDGYNGDGNAATATQFSGPLNIVFDASGDLIVAESSRIRKISSVSSSATVTNSGPICSGGTVNLYASSAGATTWSWSGPGGFTSTLQNPIVSPSTTGTYSLTVNGTICNPSLVYTTTVTVNTVPSASPSNSGPVCTGGTMILSANSTGATAWSWSGPGGFTSTLENPTASPSSSGTYSLTVSASGSGCNPSTVYTTAVTVNAGSTPTAIPSNNGAICAGSTVTLSANSTGATAWSWSGPGGFTSTSQNPTASPSASGTYSLAVSNTSCNSATVYTTTVTVNAVPTASPSNSGTICAGSSVTLSANSTGATAWSWSGPGGFTSTSQNPMASPTASGTYSLTVSNTSCSPATVYTTTVTVNAVPTASPSNSGAICAGSTVTLSANSTGATAWSWSGPGGFTSTSQNPTASPSASGTYSLTVSNTSCSSATVYTTTVTVNAVPAASPSNNGPVCAGSNVTLSANSTGATAWSWSGPGGFTSTSQNPTASPSASGTYSLIVSGTSCSSATVYTTTVTVNAVPTASPSNSGPVCAGSTVTLSANSTGATAWSWSGPGGFISTSQNPTASPSASGIYSLTVSASGSGCNPSTVYTTSVTVNSAPTASPSNNGPVCVGSTVTLSANSTGATAWSWSGPGGFTSTSQNPTASPSASGTYSLTVSGTSCSSATVYTTTVTVDVMPTANPSNNGPVCAGSTVTLSANSTDATDWSWSGPGGFTSTSQNPTASPSATGTYSLTVSNTGCSSATVYTTTVTVNTVPDVSDFSISAPDVCLSSGAIVTISSSSLSSANYTIDYDLSGSNSTTGLTASTTISSSSGIFNIPSADLTGTGSTTVTVNSITDATTGCSSTPSGGNTASFTVNSLPHVYMISPPTPSNPVGTQVTLNHSDIGFSYQLYDHTTASGSPRAGTGGLLNFGPQGNGTYTIIAADNTTGCTITMSGSVVIGTGKKPAVSTVSTASQSAGGMSVIPNPNKGDFVIKGDLGTTDDQTVTIEITDLLGQIVYSNNFTAVNGNVNEEIMLKNVADGVYVLNLRSGDTNKIFHLVIER